MKKESKEPDCLKLSLKNSSARLEQLIDEYLTISKACKTKCHYSLCIPHCTDIADCVNAGKMYHHRRMTKTTIADAIAALTKSLPLSKSYRDFEELYDLVADILKNVKGIGPLAVYDIAIRIGMYLLKTKVLPKVYVYLHAGTMQGAKRLFGVQKLPSRIPVSCFPPVLVALGSMCIEDFLCVMKDKL